MIMRGPEAHWDNVYRSKRETEVSWFEDTPERSVKLLVAAGLAPGVAVIDVGGGASRLVDTLAKLGNVEITVLDLSAEALAAARSRIADPQDIKWVVSDVTAWVPDRTYDLWHDRAAFHFLTTAEDRHAYVRVVAKALKSGGKAVISTFDKNGPETCSGLPVMRYEGASLASIFEPYFKLVHTEHHEHVTPWGSVQSFQSSILERVEA